jgi:hypothetical protein
VLLSEKASEQCNIECLSEAGAFIIRMILEIFSEPPIVKLGSQTALIQLMAQVGISFSYYATSH